MNMLKKLTTILLVLAFPINLSACGENQKTRYEAEFLTLFDTETKIVAYAESKEEFTRYSQLIYDSLKEYHELYDIYHDYPGKNNIKTINDNAGIKPVKVDKKIIDLLLFAKDWYEKTDSKMNIAFGSVLKIWHDYRTTGEDDVENAKIPPMDELKEAAQHTNINKVKIDEKNSTVYLEDPKMSLDVGAVGKGYATEQASHTAFENGFKSGLISVGGNIRSIGNKGVDGQLWNLGIQNPDTESENSTLKLIYVADKSVVSSGDYERYYTVNGKRYHHIIDPNTLLPSEHFSAVTIVTKDSGIADVLSTAIFNMPYEQGLALIDSLSDTEALWVMKDGEIKYSKSFDKYLNK
ncbi:FAD:protein FMN transferase [Ruminiclostridium cellulolyticum]|uniref:FAD:protein FMN transferase n=1 Tax=Ruminiclostridium cellulolyticum (strain ATCC 35319 / DSM 5812 / JCM 6584 / H10) TaxID=394503 RepID=B8HZX5_RUMCH|nr:FAD:protein FMN transferase [Ruminiclostridium cellulolyticum]ACL75475.1 ApbE family lipoprotein [Ruminiclostridium cellulolyticum H10]